MKRFQIAISCAAMFLMVGQAARANVWAYTSPNTGSSPLQAWQGSLGLDFNVNSSIYVTALGAFNSKGDGKVNSGPIQVAIFNRDTGVAVTPSAIFSSGTTYTLTPGKFDIQQSITQTRLNAGHYSIVAVGFSDADLNGNLDRTSPPSTTDNGGGLISFVGTARYNTDFSGTLQLPNIIDGGPYNRYDAGTFEYTATPEPGFYGLMGLGVSGLFVAVRRRRA
jgi:hypothetical protein